MTTTQQEREARYRFLMALLIDRGVLTNTRYPNGVWSLQGIYGVDDSGLRGAGTTPEEAIDNAIVAARLDPKDRLTNWRETHEQIAARATLPQRDEPVTEGKASAILRKIRQDDFLSDSTRHQIDCLLTTPPSPSLREVQADAWQPIETCPSDIEVLLYSPAASKFDEARIECRVYHNSRAGSRHAWATHWMPLPKPPELARLEEGM